MIESQLPDYGRLFELNADGNQTGSQVAVSGVGPLALADREYFRRTNAGDLWELPIAGRDPIKYFIERIWTKLVTQKPQWWHSLRNGVPMQKKNIHLLDANP